MLSYMYSGLHVKNPLFFSYFNKIEVPADFRKLLQLQCPRKSIQWELSCSMRMKQTDRQTDKTNNRFSPTPKKINNFAHALFRVVSFFSQNKQIIISLHNVNHFFCSEEAVFISKTLTQELNFYT